MIKINNKTRVKIIALKPSGKYLYSAILEITQQKEKWLTIVQSPLFEPTSWFKSDASLPAIIAKMKFQYFHDLESTFPKKFPWEERQKILNQPIKQKK
jgi:hypothetical protein